MPGIYSVSFSGVAATAQQDLFEINAPADAVVELLEWGVSNLTEVGDAAEEALLLSVITGHTTSGSGGTTPTAIPRMLGNAAYGGTVEVNNTTIASAGTAVTHDVWNWNVRVPMQRIYTPETTIFINPSARLAIRLGTTPADSITLAGYAIIREIGG